LAKYAQARPMDPLPHRLLAQMYLSGELDGDSSQDAIAHLEWLDAREQYSTTYAVVLAKRYAEVGDWANASKKAERATRIAPYDGAARELAASVAIKAGDLDRAERHIRALIVLEPDQPVHARRLDALLKMKSK
jgi:Flp pilus assembly protein TadD